MSACFEIKLHRYCSYRTYIDVPMLNGLKRFGLPRLHINRKLKYVCRIDRTSVALLAQNRRAFQPLVERLCNMFDRT